MAPWFALGRDKWIGVAELRVAAVVGFELDGGAPPSVMKPW